MRVKLKSTGQLGDIPDDKFDPNLFEPVAVPMQSGNSSMAQSIGNGAVNILKDIVQPFNRTGKNIVAATAQTPLMLLKSVLEQGRSNENLPTPVRKLAASGSDKTTGALDFLKVAGGLSDQEFQDTAANPMKAMTRQLKDSANVASWAVPFGKGGSFLTKALLPGAGVGALQGVSEDNATSESVLGNTVMGAGGAVALHGASKLFGLLGKGGASMEKLSDKLKEGTRQIRQKPSISGASQEKAINETLNRLGFKGTAQQQYERLQPAMQELEGQIHQIIKNNPNISVPKEEIKKSFFNSMKSAMRSGEITETQAKKEINKYMGDLIKASGGQGKFTDISLERMRALKKLINEDYGPVKALIDRGGALTPRQQVIANAWGSLDDAVKNASPEVKKLLIQESNLYKAAPSLSSARSNPPTLRAAGFSIPQGATQTARDVAGATASITGKLLQAPGKLSTGGMPASSIGARLPFLFPKENGDQIQNEQTNAYDNNGQNNASSNFQHNSSIPQQGNNEPILDESGQWKWNPQINDWEPNTQPQQGGGITREQIGQAMLMDLLQNGGKNIPELKAISEFAVQKEPKQTTPTEFDKKFKFAGQEAQKAYKILDTQNIPTGKIAGVTSKIQEFLGTQPESITEFKSQGAIARTAVMNALLGANMSPAEVERIADFIFDYNQEPRVIKQRLKTFIQSMDDYQNNIAGGGDVIGQALLQLQGQ